MTPQVLNPLLQGLKCNPDPDKQTSRSSKRRKNDDKKSQGLVKATMENSDSDQDLVQDSVNDENCVRPVGGAAKRKRTKADSSLQIPAKEKLICGVDFGMTNSGLAFGVDTKAPESATCQKTYPGCSEHRSKVPTVIAYQQENQAHEVFSENDSSEIVESVFGFEVEKGMRRHAYFKTALDKGTSATPFDDPSLSSEAAESLLKRSRNRVALQAVKDCLLHLRKIFIKNLRLQVGNADDNVINRYILKTVLTHPAAMSLEGRANLRKAAVDSGWLASPGSEIILRSEAEAAAIAAFITYRSKFGAKAFTDAFKVWSENDRPNHIS